jgi:hypothetical protein
MRKLLASLGTVAIGFGVASLTSGTVLGQTKAATAAAAAKAYSAPRTPWGHPDLQGAWNNGTSTPLERPSALAGKAVLTEEETEELSEKQQATRENRDSREGAGTDVDVARAYNALWYPVPGKAIGRTSLITDPPDGKVPAMTPEGTKRAAAFAEGRQGPPAGPEDRSLWERCLTRGVPRLPGGYNNHFQIVQSAGSVAILIEMIHEVRIIPLDGTPHLPGVIRQWLGDSRGHWEGDTLVVDTTNFSDKTNFRGSGAGLHVVERFTRTSRDTVNYEFTVEDPGTWSRPWTASFPLTSLQSAVGGVDQVTVPSLFEYACHEGNYGLMGQLSGARAQEQAAADAAKKGSR